MWISDEPNIEFLSVRLKDGFVELGYNVGDGDLWLTWRQYRLDDSAWHVIDIKRSVYSTVCFVENLVLHFLGIVIYRDLGYGRQWGPEAMPGVRRQKKPCRKKSLNFIISHHYCRLISCVNGRFQLFFSLYTTAQIVINNCTLKLCHKTVPCCI